MISDSVPEFKALDLNDSNWDSPSEPSSNEEPLLAPNPNRFVLFPIQYQNIWEAYKDSQNIFWSAEEIELNEDVEGFNSLTGKEKAFIIEALSILSSNESIVKRFGTEIQVAEARSFYGYIKHYQLIQVHSPEFNELGFQMMQENIHREIINIMLDTFTNQLPHHGEEKEYFHDWFVELSAMSKKVAWTQANIIDSKHHFSTRTICSGLFISIFSSSIDIIQFHFSKFTKSQTNKFSKSAYSTPLPGFLKALIKIHVDKSNNFKFAVIIKNHLSTAPSQDTITRLVNSAVEIEFNLIDELYDSCGGKLTIMNQDIDIMQIKNHVKYVANQSVQAFGYSPVFNVKSSPFLWVQDIIDVELGVYGVKQVKQETFTSKAQPQEVLFTIDADF